MRLMDTQYVSGVTRTETRESTREILLRTSMHSFPIEMFARLSRPLASSDETLVAKIGFYFKNNKRSFLSCAEYTLNFVRVPQIFPRGINILKYVSYNILKHVTVEIIINLFYVL